MEEYRRNLYIQFEELPPIELKTVKPDHNTGFFERLALASKRRLFSLKKDWKFQLGEIDYQSDMNGRVIIPREVDGKKIYYDGATIPFPWLVSLLTIGILRPLGVMLIGSIVHDFAYRHGYLLLEKEDKTHQYSIERHVADRLLRDIIATVNNMPVIAFFGWLFVRFGWLFVRYNNQRFGGRVPYWEIPLALVILVLIVHLVLHHTTFICVLAVLIYGGVYLLRQRLD